MLTTRLSCSAPDAEYSGRRRQDENSCRPPYIKLFGDLLAFVYHCFNRIVMHGYLTCLSRPEHVVPRSRRGSRHYQKDLTSTDRCLPELGGSVRRNHKIPVQWPEKGTRKEDYVLRWRRRMEKKTPTACISM